jgi:hypothetical protein
MKAISNVLCADNLAMPYLVVARLLGLRDRIDLVNDGRKSQVNTLNTRGRRFGGQLQNFYQSHRESRSRGFTATAKTPNKSSQGLIKSFLVRFGKGAYQVCGSLQSGRFDIFGQIVVQGSQFSVDNTKLNTSLARRMGRIMDRLIFSVRITATLSSHGGVCLMRMCQGICNGRATAKTWRKEFLMPLLRGKAWKLPRENLMIFMCRGCQMYSSYPDTQYSLS